MRQFFKFMFASCLGSLLMIFVLGFIFIMSISIKVGSLMNSQAEQTKIRSNSILEITLDKPIVERSTSPVESVLSGNITQGLNTLLRAINHAKNDRNIDGIYIKPTFMFDAGWASVDELRMALKDFRKTGKFVYCYSDSYSQKAYFLATACDSIYLNPSGNIELQGIGAQVMFIKDLLAKMDVDVELIRPGSNAFKSAGETFILNKMSDANREQVHSYLSNIWTYVSGEIASSRKIPDDKLQAIVDDLQAYDPRAAIDQHLIDRLAFETEIYSVMAEKCMKTSASQLTFIPVSKYSIVTIKEPKEEIAIIYADGDVKTGKGNLNDIYSDNIKKAIQDAVDNDNVKAIVFRVNSPGGEVLGSEVMTHAVFQAKLKKPIIVSMGDVAASAGYEISCYATKIVAHPTTLTGSIGVFGVIPNFGKALKNNLGITFDTISTNKNTHGISVIHPLSPRAKAVMVKSVEDFYVTFCTRIAEGRGLSFNEVESIARGRVWTGAQALEIGLVDELGGIEKAIEVAAKEANISSYAIREYPKQKDSFTQLMESFRESAQMKVLGNQYPKINQYVKELEKISNIEGIQARLPFILEME